MHYPTGCTAEARGKWWIKPILSPSVADRGRSNAVEPEVGALHCVALWGWLCVVLLFGCAIASSAEAQVDARCTDANVTVLHARFDNTKELMELSLGRTGDKIMGKAKFFERSGRVVDGTVSGHIVDRTLALTVAWVHISSQGGRIEMMPTSIQLFDGKGGWSTATGSDGENQKTLALNVETVTGCAKWPEDLWAFDEAARQRAPFGSGTELSSAPPQRDFSCQGAMVLGTDNTCRCPAATRWNGSRCLGAQQTALACDAIGMVGAADGTCTCRVGSVWSGSRCESLVASPIRADQMVGRLASQPAPPQIVRSSELTGSLVVGSPIGRTSTEAPGAAPQRCAWPRPFGQWPTCCPVNFYAAGGRCLALMGPASPRLRGERVRVPDVPPQRPAVVKCPANRPVGRYPYCCPAGTQYHPGGVCRPVTVQAPALPRIPDSRQPASPRVVPHMPKSPASASKDTGTVDVGICGGCAPAPKLPR